MKMVYHSTNIGYCLYATTTQYAFYNLKKKKKVETKPSDSCPIGVSANSCPSGVPCLRE